MLTATLWFAAGFVIGGAVCGAGCYVFGFLSAKTILEKARWPS